MFIDAHAHIYDCDVKDVMARAKDALVDYVICPSSDFLTIEKSLYISNIFDNIYSCIGFHPQDADQFLQGGEAFLLRKAQNKKVVAIGEIGLDYHFGKPDFDLQKQVFIQQILIAEKLKLPVVIHIRDAMDDALNILEKYKNHLNNGVIIHCFNGNEKDAARILNLGFNFTVGGIVTFKNSGILSQVVKQIPIEKIMLETDSPYLAPEPLRGTKNEPKNLVWIAEKIAQIKNLNVEDVAKITSDNAKRIFRI